MCYKISQNHSAIEQLFQIRKYAFYPCLEAYPLSLQWKDQRTALIDSLSCFEHKHPALNLHRLLVRDYPPKTVERRPCSSCLVNWDVGNQALKVIIQPTSDILLSSSSFIAEKKYEKDKICIAAN